MKITYSYADKNSFENNFKTVLDLCTGSGCLAISVKKNADVSVCASDVSMKALQIAKLNAKIQINKYFLVLIWFFFNL